MRLRKKIQIKIQNIHTVPEYKFCVIDKTLIMNIFLITGVFELRVDNKRVNKNWSVRDNNVYWHLVVRCDFTEENFHLLLNTPMTIITSNKRRCVNLKCFFCFIFSVIAHRRELLTYSFLRSTVYVLSVFR